MSRRLLRVLVVIGLLVGAFQWNVWLSTEFPDRDERIQFQLPFALLSAGGHALFFLVRRRRRRMAQSHTLEE